MCWNLTLKLLSKTQILKLFQARNFEIDLECPITRSVRDQKYLLEWVEGNVAWSSAAIQLMPYFWPVSVRLIHFFFIPHLLFQWRPDRTRQSDHQHCSSRCQDLHCSSSLILSWMPGERSSSEIKHSALMPAARLGHNVCKWKKKNEMLHG